jgi:hypothetical protein
MKKRFLTSTFLKSISVSVLFGFLRTIKDILELTKELKHSNIRGTIGMISSE